MWESPLSGTEEWKPAPAPRGLGQGCLCVRGVHAQGTGRGESSCGLPVLYGKVTHPVLLINHFLPKFDWCNTVHPISLPRFSDLQKVLFLRLRLDPAVANPALATLLKSAEAPPFARRILTYFSRRLSRKGEQDAEYY